MTSTVEVATDAAFTTIVTTQTVSPDATGRLTILLDHLSPATNYYWRVKTSAGDNGVVSASQSFSIGPLLVIQPPTPVQPLADTFPHKRPTFTVVNATHTGPDATLTYRFDVATDSASANVVTSGTTPEGSGQTSFTPDVDLKSGMTYYWRARGTDPSKDVAGPYSPPQAFTTINPDEGRFSYNLHVSCQTRFGPAYHSLPGVLEVDGHTLRLSLAPSLNLQMARAGRHLSGTIAGQFYALPVWPPYVLDIGGSKGPLIYRPVGAATLSGDGSNDGTLSGTFDGYAVIGYYPEAHDCIGPYSWELTPR